jgi:hypothetical protein
LPARDCSPLNKIVKQEKGLHKIGIDTNVGNLVA